jgi:hypothetical protein
MKDKYLGHNLIFLISQPRSGSTMLQRILDGNSNVHAPQETWLMLTPAYELKSNGIRAEYNAKLANFALKDFLKYYAGGEETYFEAVRAWARILYGAALNNSKKEYFLDKTPRYYYIIPELYRFFPEAKFIFLLRNPLAVLSSILRSWVKEDWPLLAFYRDDLLLAPRYILEGIKTLGKGAIVLRYEDLVIYPKRTITNLCQALNLSFNDEMLNYGSRQKPKGVHGDKVSTHFYKAPSNENLNKWLELVNHRQTQHFALSYIDQLGPDIVDELGYSFKEMKSSISSEKHNSSGPIFPWHIALSPKGGWSPKDRLIAKRTMAIQKMGFFQGNVSFIQNNFRAIVRFFFPF